MAEKQQIKSVDQLRMQQKRKCDDILNRNCRRKLFSESFYSTSPTQNVTIQGVDEKLLHTSTSPTQSEKNASDMLIEAHAKIPTCTGSNVISYCQELS